MLFEALGQNVLQVMLIRTAQKYLKKAFPDFLYFILFYFAFFLFCRLNVTDCRIKFSKRCTLISEANLA